MLTATNISVVSWVDNRLSRSRRQYNKQRLVHISFQAVDQHNVRRNVGGTEHEGSDGLAEVDLITNVSSNVPFVPEDLVADLS